MPVLTRTMPMDPDQQKQQFSFAWVRAVATVAGFDVSMPEVDDDSIDLRIASRSRSGRVTRPRVELQVKCEGGDAATKGTIPYRLKRKNYDDLRDENVLVPRILVVTRVPRRPAEWLEAADDQMLLRRCSYWMSLRGLPATSVQKKTVHVPVAQCFNPPGLSDLMGRIQDGGHP